MIAVDCIRNAQTGRRRVTAKHFNYMSRDFIVLERELLLLCLETGFLGVFPAIAIVVNKQF